jgi:hypothetical protein
MWYPGGQALPSNIGWHFPPGPRQNPGPHPSATLITKLLALPAGTGVTAALATVATPKANATPKKAVLIILYSSCLDETGTIHRLGRKPTATAPFGARRAIN